MTIPIALGPRAENHTMVTLSAILGLVLMAPCFGMRGADLDELYVDGEARDPSICLVGLGNSQNNCFVAAAHQLLIHSPHTLSYLLDDSNLIGGSWGNPVAVLQGFATSYSNLADYQAMSKPDFLAFRKELSKVNNGMLNALAPIDDKKTGARNYNAQNDAGEVLIQYLTSYNLTKDPAAPIGTVRKESGKWYPCRSGNVQRAGEELQSETEIDRLSVFVLGTCKSTEKTEDCYKLATQPVPILEGIPIFQLPDEGTSFTAAEFPWIVVNEETVSESDAHKIFVPGENAVLQATSFVERIVTEVPATTVELIVQVKRTSAFNKKTFAIGPDDRPLSFDLARASDGRVLYIDAGIPSAVAPGAPFELSGCAVRNGDVYGGHWYAYVKVQDTWYQFNDASVSRVATNSDSAHQQVATQLCTRSSLLLFKRVTTTVPPIPAPLPTLPEPSQTVGLRTAPPLPRAKVTADENQPVPTPTLPTARESLSVRAGLNFAILMFALKLNMF